MIEKRLLHRVFLHIHKGGMRVTYWDGSTENYGPGDPYFHITFHSPVAARSILRNMTLGFGESFMDGLITVDGDLENVGRLVSENTTAFKSLELTKLTRLPRRNTRRRQAKQVQHHYDLGNDFYKLWLGDSMIYSCAYFRTADNSLEIAQEQKLDYVLRKLQIEPGQRILDIGSGWGTLLIKAAKEHAITGLGITLSQQQLDYSRAQAEKAGLQDRISFELLNYQELATRKLEWDAFDRIVSVGMYEHVGRRNQRNYHMAISRMLRPGGISVLHSITTPLEARTDPWIDKYIFPGGYLPSTRQVAWAAPEYGLNLLDYENLRLHYALTLEEWHRRFSQHSKAIADKYDERFERMWRLYLASAAAGFRYGDLHLSQFVFSKGLNNTLPLTREYLYK